MGKPGFPTPPPRRGMGKPGFPIPPPAGGCGRAQPSERGVGEPGSPISPPAGGPGSHAGEWGNRVSPRPRPREGVGGRSPSEEQPVFILFVCGVAAWTAEVNTVRSVLPPSQPPPAGGRTGFPPPAGEGQGGGPSPSLQRSAARAGGWRNRVSLSTHPVGGRSPRAGGWGNLVSPCSPIPSFSLGMVPPGGMDG